MTLSARSVSRNLVRLAVTMEESLAIHVEHSSDETLRDGVKKKMKFIHFHPFLLS